MPQEEFKTPQSEEKPIPKYEVEHVFSYKIVLIGDGAVGKTTFLKRHLTGEFARRYIATLGVEVHSLTFYTTHGPIRFDVWDTAGQEKMGGLREAYYIHADAAIIMFDVNDRSTYRNVARWYKDLIRICTVDTPIVVCGNKVDIADRIPSRHISLGKSRNVVYFNTSAKENYHIEEPFLWLARYFFRDQNVDFVPQPAVAPPEFHIDASMKPYHHHHQQQQQQQKIENAGQVPLPSDSEGQNMTTPSLSSSTPPSSSKPVL